MKVLTSEEGNLMADNCPTFAGGWTGRPARINGWTHWSQLWEHTNTCLKCILVMQKYKIKGHMRPEV